MCNFFSAIVNDEGQVLWRNGISSHSELEKALNIRDDGHSAKVELTPPPEGPFNDVEKWVFKIDEARTPEWWDGAYEGNVRQVVNDWMCSNDRYTWDGDLDLGGLTSAKGLTLPQEIGGDLNLGGLTSAEGLTLPQEIGGDLYLGGLTSAERESVRARIGK